MNLNEKAALVIRSLMRQMGLSDHIVFYAQGNVIAESVLEELDAPKVGDGTPDAALAIGEHAFRAGYDAAARVFANAAPIGHQNWEAGKDYSWGQYDPPEDIKALS